MERPLFYSHPRAETCFGKLPKEAEGYCEKLRCRAVYAGILKTPLRKTKQIWVASSPYPVFQVSGLKRALFRAPGGQGPIRKRQFGRHPKTIDENRSNPVRLLKCHVRREKGPTRGPGGPSVAGRGAHVSTAGKRSGAKTKKFEVPILPPEDLSVP